ncbi:MAG: MotA/TolQ/ExbB proton channel family protein [Planctomycetes bacterium]|nr:MotA/TolQ/ExbB proton channel family protein [Planctomycetota bacterium]
MRNHVMLFCLLILALALSVHATFTFAQQQPATVGLQSASPDVSVPNAQPPKEGLTTGEAFWLKLKQGGSVMIFLGLASVAGVACIIERLVNLRRAKMVPEGLADKADELWQAGKWQQLEAMTEKGNSMLARIISVILDHRHRSASAVSTLAGEMASRDLRREQQRAYPMAVVATVSPLLGLLGTVVGMIGAFDKVAAAGSLGDASMLGGDISKALITTATGLSIAVPALVFYHYFKTRISAYSLLLEEEVSELINLWFAPKPEEVANAD